MSTRRSQVSKAEFRTAFSCGAGAQFPPILTVQQLADLLQLSRKTIYEWIAKGRLDGAFRKRGKHILVWRDKALDILFNGPDWRPDEKQESNNERK